MAIPPMLPIRATLPIGYAYVGAIPKRRPKPLPPATGACFDGSRYLRGLGCRLLPRSGITIFGPRSSKSLNRKLAALNNELRAIDAL